MYERSTTHFTWKIVGQQIKMPNRKGPTWLLLTKGFQVCLNPVAKEGNAKEIAHAIANWCIDAAPDTSLSVTDFNELSKMLLLRRHSDGEVMDMEIG